MVDGSHPISETDLPSSRLLLILSIVNPSALPVEVIQRILKYTFLPSSPLTPLSDPHHPRGTTHVLLVSRAIRQLALPFVYHTIIISRPSDFVTFFDPEHGLLNAGEDGKRRWSLVREIGIVAGVWPELATALHGDRRYLVPLEIPSAGNIKIACILDGALFDHWSTRDNLVEVIKFINRSPALADVDFPDHPDRSEYQDYSDYLDDILEEVSDERAALNLELISRSTLCEMRLSRSTAEDMYSLFFGASQASTSVSYSLRIFYSSPREGKTDESFDGADWAVTLREVRNQVGQVQVVRLQGWPQDLLEKVSRGFEQAVASNGTDFAARGLSTWVWTWQGKDGKDVHLVPLVSHPIPNPSLESKSLLIFPRLSTYRVWFPTPHGEPTSPEQTPPFSTRPKGVSLPFPSASDPSLLHHLRPSVR